PLYPRRWSGLGLLIALAPGLGSLVWGVPFLTRHTAHRSLPGVGEIHGASALVVDIGVVTLVVGSTMLILTGIAHQSVRSHRYRNARAADDEQAPAAIRGEGPWN
ncbi:MAG: MnhB domain-containing protein, partial [Acidovorax sp.]